MFLTCAMLLAATLPAHAADFTLDSVHTQIFACVSHLRFSKPCARFKIKSGFFHFADGDWSMASVDAVIDATSLDLGDASSNAKIRSRELLDTGKYPEAHLVSQSAESAGER